MANSAKVIQEETKEKKPLLRATEQSLRPSADVQKKMDEAEQKANELEGPWQNAESKQVKGNTINDRTLGDKDIPGFLEELKKRNLENISDEDFIDLFLLYKKSPEEAAADLERKYKAWTSKIKKEVPGLWGKVRETLRLPEIKSLIGKFPDSFAWERAYGAFLDKRVQELHTANLNARDRIKLLNHAFEVQDKFESQAILISLGHTSDFDEELVEDYYTTFAKQEEGKIRDADGTVVGKDIGHLGSVKDMWFEIKLRRETHSRGKRPDVWHNGTRDYLWHGNHIVGVAWKSKKWIAEETNFDGRLSPGRKGDTASETFQYNLMDGTKVKELGMRKLLEKKLIELEDKLTNPTRVQEFRQNMEEFDQKIQTLRDLKDKLAGIDTLVYDQKIVELEKKRDRLKKEWEDDKRQQELINLRLKEGIDRSGIKSMLLDKSSRDFVTVVDPETGEEVKVYEREVAYSRGTFIYAMARSESDVKIITNAEHVTSEERLSQAQFFSDRYRDELQWRAQHYNLGIHDIEGNYDPTRDGAQNIWKLMFKGTPGGQNFQRGALGYFVSDKPIEGSKRIIEEYRDENTNRTYNVWLDYQLPDDPSGVLKEYNRADPDAIGKLDKGKSLTKEWSDLIKKAYEKGQFYDTEIKHEKTKLGHLAEALTKTDSSHAREILGKPKSGRLEDEFTIAANELKDYRIGVAREEGTFIGLPPAYEKQLIDISEALLRANEDVAFRLSFEAVEAAASNLILGSDEEKKKITDGLDKINSKLAAAEKGFENMALLRAEFEPQIEAILARQPTNEPAHWYARKIESSLKGKGKAISINKLKNSLPLDAQAELTLQQREQMAELIGEPVAPTMTALEAWSKLNNFQIVLSLVYRELLPHEAAETKESKQSSGNGDNGEEEE